MKNFLKISAFSMLLSSCIPAAIVGGASLLGYTASQERTVGDALNDASIEASINAYILGSDHQVLFSDVEIDSVEGRVLLTGAVPSREAKIEIYNIAWKAKGVREVINEVEVRDEHVFSASEIASDAWISTQIGSALLFNKEIQSRNYSVETIKGVVYLMGVAQSKAELDKASSVASQIKGVKKVVSYVRIKSQQMSRGNEKTINNTADEVFSDSKKTEDKAIIIEDISKDKIDETKTQTSPSQTPNEGGSYYRKPLMEDLSGS